jgi:hypothetical protein
MNVDLLSGVLWRSVLVMPLVATRCDFHPLDTEVHLGCPHPGNPSRQQTLLPQQPLAGEVNVVLRELMPARQRMVIDLCARLLEHGFETSRIARRRDRVEAAGDDQRRLARKSGSSARIGQRHHSPEQPRAGAA